MRTGFLWVARLEGLSLLVLFGVAMPLKYGLGWSHATWWPGLLHGLLFMAYIGATLLVAQAERWSAGTSALAFAASLVPFGTFAFERRAMPARTPSRHGRRREQ